MTNTVWFQVHKESRRVTFMETKSITAVARGYGEGNNVKTLNPLNRTLYDSQDGKTFMVTCNFTMIFKNHPSISKLLSVIAIWHDYIYLFICFYLESTMLSTVELISTGPNPYPLHTTCLIHSVLEVHHRCFLLHSCRLIHLRRSFCSDLRGPASSSSFDRKPLEYPCPRWSNHLVIQQTFESQLDILGLQCWTKKARSRPS